MRSDGRAPLEMRAVKITRGFLKHPEGSVLMELGSTRVICTASVEEDVPRFLKNSNQGWVTSEYSMLPRSTLTRTPRESAAGRVGGRTHEIQRLIGRSLRSVVDLSSFGRRTIWIDCDVIQADGGTRTASITGAYVAVTEAVKCWLDKGKLLQSPIMDAVAAVSIGIVDGKILLDLCYEEDSIADVDMNFVMTGSGKFIEVQGTAESEPFTRKQMERMAEIAQGGIKDLLKAQKQAIAGLD